MALDSIIASHALLLLSEGLLLHMVRKPTTEVLLASGGINVQSDIISQICASIPRFRSLIAACTSDPILANTTVSGTQLGGIGTDPVFNRSAGCMCID
jgi:hypothetical protein